MEQLEHAVLARLNGCAKGGVPDKNDWILDCGAQAQSYPLIIEAMGLIESLLSAIDE